MALASLLAADSRADEPSNLEVTANPLAPKLPPQAAKAKRVIYLHMTGSPPNLDMFDYKPELSKFDGTDCPEQYTKGKEFAFTSGTPKLLGSPRKWKQVGSSGMWMSDAVPHFHDIADEMCVMHGMFTDQFNHAPAELLMLTGSPRSAARLWVRGQVMVWAARTRTCPRLLF